MKKIKIPSKIKLRLLFSSFVFLNFVGITAAQQLSPSLTVGTLTVIVSNVQHREGNIKAILQNRSNFLTPQYIADIDALPTKNDVQMVFKNLPLGDYAVAIYHDLNANDNFDRNWIGYPKEPFAVSNNLHPFKLLYPSFDAAKVRLTDKGAALTIHLLNN
jgi:uncharacterized protein (DUF2141 family)